MGNDKIVPSERYLKAGEGSFLPIIKNLIYLRPTKKATQPTIRISYPSSVTFRVF